MSRHLRIRIEHDGDPESPRDWDNIGTMACWHRRGSYGDEQPKESMADYVRMLANGAVDFKCHSEEVPDEHVQAAFEKHFAYHKIHAYDHGGITLSTSKFSCPWDSGLLGIIYVDFKDAVKRYWGDMKDPPTSWDSIVRPGGEDDTPQMTFRQAIEGCLEGEVTTYSQFLEGDVWGYVVEEFVGEEDDYEDPNDDGDNTRNENWQEVDSCWGYYGRRYCLSEAQSIIKHHEKEHEDQERYLATCSYDI